MMRVKRPHTPYKRPSQYHIEEYHRLSAFPSAGTARSWASKDYWSSLRLMGVVKVSQSIASWRWRGRSEDGRSPILEEASWQTSPRLVLMAQLQCP